MKKVFSFNLLLVLLLLCGCTETKENKETQFLMDTVVTLRADCSDEVLSAAFSLCKDYEKLLSRTIEGSDVWRLNESGKAVEVSPHTKEIIERSLYYSRLTDGKFDITVYAVSSLWDFNEEIIPSRDEIAAALPNIDYESIRVLGNQVSLGGKKIDLGGIAKGYIADRVLEYFKENNVKRGIIDLGGNIVVFGDKEYSVGIKKPFTADELSATIRLKNKSVVTSGIYERYIKTDDEFYHHIIDTATGYSAESDLYSATVICDSAIDADALATVCVLLGRDKAAELIESTPDTEAVFIDKNEKITYPSGLLLKGGSFYLK